MTAAQNIIDAFTHGGPLVSCWNESAGWNLNQQVAWIEDGHHYFPCVFVPQIRRANKPERWTEWFNEYGESLKYLNEHRLPVTLCYGNWLDEYCDAPENQRGPFEDSPLVWRKLADGTLDSTPTIDPLGPVAAWSSLGERIATTQWLANLAALLPNCPRFYLLENNESPLHGHGHYTAKLKARDEYGEQLRDWLPNLETINARMPAFAAEHPDANQLELLVARLYTEKYEAFTDALLDNLPGVMRGKSYTGAYGGIDLTSAKFDYRRPQEDWSNAPWSHALRRYGEPSERCYDDGSGGGNVRRELVRSPQHCQTFVAPVNEYLSDQYGLLWHSDTSLWISPKRAANLESGVVLPDGMKGFARACLWASKCENRATVMRWFAESTKELSDSWFGNLLPAMQNFTHGDYFDEVMNAVDEVYDHDLLLEFFRRGEAVLTNDPPLCDWKLPAAMQFANRVLETDADITRYTVVDDKVLDRWRANNGQGELNVFALAWRIDQRYLVFAYSPRGKRENVTVRVPGCDNVLFDSVDESGEFRYTQTGWGAIH